MKIYKYLLLVPVLLFWACDLDKSPYGISNFWNTAADVEIALNAAYAPLYEEDGYGRGQYWSELGDDYVYNRGRTNEDPIAAFTSEVNSSGGMHTNWKLMYRTIRRVNDVMKHAPTLVTDENRRDIVLGEANFLAGYAYFFLAKRYGGLPFYDYSSPTEINKPRETKTETYKRIVAYLETSIKHFEAQNAWYRGQGEEGRPSLGAAYGLLAKVYMHWGGTANFTKAKEYSGKVIESGQYNLEKNDGNGFAHLFSPKGEKSKEVLFNLVNKPIRHEGSIVSVVLLSGALSKGTGWYYFAPTKDLRAAFEAGDLRREVTLKGAGDMVSYPALVTQQQEEENKLAAKEGREPKLIKAPITLTEKMLADMSAGYMCAKYASVYETLPSWNWEAGADQPLLRYADVLLIHAEAIMQLAGAGPSNQTQVVAAAEPFLNEVRVRAFGGDVTAKVDANFENLMKERRCELAYEDERHFDLVRWGLAKEVYGKGVSVGDPRGNRVFDPAKDNHLPIPQTEIENTGFLLENNPKVGYSTFGAE